MVSGGAVLIVDNGARENGYLTADRTPLSYGGYALTTTGVNLGVLNSDSLLGQIRLRAGSDKAATPVFLGITQPAAGRRLPGEIGGNAIINEIGDPVTAYVEHPGGAPEGKPGDSDIWVESATGTGTQAVSWPAGDGPWTVVVMNADGSAEIDVSADIGATIPVLRPIGYELVRAGLFAGLAGAALVFLAIRLARGAQRPVKRPAPVSTQI